MPSKDDGTFELLRSYISMLVFLNQLIDLNFQRHCYKNVEMK
jgi:hypothetical protein